MISRSRAGRSRSLASRGVRAGFQSGMFGPRDLPDRVHEFPPVVALRGEHVPALRREAVEPATTFSGLLDPFPRDPAALLQAVEQRIERRDLELHASGGSLFDQFADL